ncbi:PREDICTED: auxin efflux carrier component 8 [Tarenaya hassleriana]|uniref:auxin efflux carrier component 8 n=1 Tax=Tarenaya hassleriana TaxID=28532 RepID=UPI00053C9E5A|nr:PREDICTED: auxin efflux carrier component 8 [Tarenaya hassleriana]
MISWLDVYHVVSSTVPLYVTMILGYVSAKHLKLFSPEQCSGINTFVSKFSIPLLSFQVISQNNPYKMNPRLILSDALQKILAAVSLAAVVRFWRPAASGGRLGLIITGFSISTLPNTLIIGIPMLRAMYGDGSVDSLVQIIVLQSLIWYNLLLFLFELNAARSSVAARVPTEHRGNENTDAEQEPKEEEETVLAYDSSTGRILLKVWRKLVRNPNSYATLAGLIWASIHFRLGWEMPGMVDGSIRLLSDGGLGMAMFSLGLFMASQRSIIACGKQMLAITMVLKFLIGPILMVASAFGIRLHGTLLRTMILQSALPQGIVPFVFAKEYNVYPEIVSTGVIFGMVVALPIALAYYFVMAL